MGTPRLITYACPLCRATTRTFPNAIVGHRCPMARGNALTQWTVQDEDEVAQ